MAPKASTGGPQWSGVEHRFGSRSNERTERDAGQMAPLVCERRFGGQLPTNFVDEKFSSPELKAAVQRLLSELTPEQLAFRESLESQAGAAASVWTERYELDVCPSRAQLEAGARRWLKTLPSQVLEGFRTLCPDTASLVVFPNLRTETLLKVLKRNGVESEINLRNWGREQGDSMDMYLHEGSSMECWNVAITDGKENIPFDSEISLRSPGFLYTHQEMISGYSSRFNRNNVGMMPSYGYVPSAARALAQGKHLDTRFFTIFKKRDGDEYGRRIGRWSYNRLALGNSNYGPKYDEELRCRPWFEGPLNF